MKTMTAYRAGIDIGSTTVKLVLLDAQNQMIYGEYRRHRANTQEALCELLLDARKQFPLCDPPVCMTGSGSLELAKVLGAGFVQEVTAVANAIKANIPKTDVAIELGGEDAKIIYFKGGLEQRMNGVCAGGTGAFIDQMASLLKTDAAGLNDLASQYGEIYPIAARCGVFAKSDIQPLINEGASREDLAASIFQAVVNQTISGLACGKPICGNVAFLGGPLHFLTELQNAFIRTLGLTKETAIMPENSHLFAAFGAALDADSNLTLSHLMDRLEKGVTLTHGLKHLPVLFKSQLQYKAFMHRHEEAKVTRGCLKEYHGDCFLGIDGGSTTTKLALIDTEGKLLYSFYANNQGNPIETVRSAVKALSMEMPADVHIVRSCATGYGETLLKSAFCLDEGEVETIAHYTAAAFFEPDVDCVLDIGGQDMKCIRLKNGTVNSVLLNEACSSGCGSFLESFADSLGYTAEDFAKEALFATAPLDLGTRCTVFMNSNVKQAQKQGASLKDIAAGLSYSVIKNALYKVIKLAEAQDLGKHIVVQGGTFHNKAVLRAFELLLEQDVVCPDISGIMGAFGAALLAQQRYEGQPTTTLSFEQITNLDYQAKTLHCEGCTNQCMLTVTRFPGGRRHVTGNRCEKGTGVELPKEIVPNAFDYKLKRLFDYQPLAKQDAPRGIIGIPRTLNIYENYPFWATLLKELGFHVKLSPLSSRYIYEKGMGSIPSESECYPAKLAHGHIQWLIDEGVSTIFYPCVFYENQEDSSSQNHYNCPMVIGNPENIVNNVEDIACGKARLLKPFLAFTNEKTAADRLATFFKEQFNIPHALTKKAATKAWSEQQAAKEDIHTFGQQALAWMEEHKRKGIVLAGRPYHIDPEINHGIAELIASYGMAVLTEDSIPAAYDPHTLRVTDQWVYHSRLYRAAEFVCTRKDLELIQLNSFGCGLDAITTDQVSEILKKANKLYTLIKIDEVNSLGAARIRIRSLLAAAKQREKGRIYVQAVGAPYKRAEFTEEMYDAGYTILAPNMSPLHFNIVEPVLRKYGYNVVILDSDTQSAIDVGLKFVNNDACYPSIITVGQLMDAVLSNKYDTNKIALAMTQTGGCCRASNYVGLLRRALDQVGLSHIPVLSINLNNMEKNSGFKITPPLLLDAMKALTLGDLLMRCLYRMRPYELIEGSANHLAEFWTIQSIDSLTSAHPKLSYTETCHALIEAFDNLPINTAVSKPRVGIVGEILVKYMPLANSHLVDLLESEGAEAVVPDMMDFFSFFMYNGVFAHEYLGKPWRTSATAQIGVSAINAIRKPAIKALKRSQHFTTPTTIHHIAKLAQPIISLGNQYGEGWFLTGEMAELLTTGISNIVCVQPFACLPNHLVGKGVIKKLRSMYPKANIVAVDYDPGSSEANQLNRLKLMLSIAQDTLSQMPCPEQAQLFFSQPTLAKLVYPNL